MILDLIAAVDRPLAPFRAPLLAGFIALVVSWFLTPLVRNLAIRKGAVDDPKSDDRRVHKTPTPRWGGLAIYGGLLVAVLTVLPYAYPKSQPFPSYLIGMLVIGAVLVIVGALDDLYQYKAKIQALVLLAAGVAIQFFYGSVGRIQIGSVGVPLGNPGDFLYLGIFSIPLTAIYIFVVTKTMDTIDGVDGLASGMATISAGTLTIIAAYSGQPRVAVIAAATAGAAIGFLSDNYNPAKIFMGTGGAYILGFTLACLSIVGALKTAAAVSIVIPLLVFGIPIFDAFFVITRRVLSGQPITQADKRHLHHTLMGRGLTVKQTMWVMCLFAAMLCGVAIMVIRSKG